MAVLWALGAMSDSTDADAAHDGAAGDGAASAPTAIAGDGVLPTPTSSLALLTVLEPRLNPTPGLGPTLLDRASLPVVAIAGARAYSALSCVCARWGGVTHPGTLVRAAALQFKFPIEAFSIRSTLPLPVRRNCTETRSMIITLMRPGRA